MSSGEEADRKASYGILVKVSKANTGRNTTGGIQNGQEQFVTYMPEMPVPYSIHPKISVRSIVWERKSRCTRDYQDIMSV